MNEQMKTVIRNILAIVAGVVAGAVIIMVVQKVGHQVYPVTGEVDYTDKEAMAEFVKSLPAGALWFVIVSYALGSLAGGAVAAFIGRGARLRHALVVGALLLIAGLMNLIAVPHPVWFSVITVLVFLPAAWLGGKLVTGAGQGPGA